jgi:hypothetical protein
VERAFSEKVNELHDWIALVQSLSKEASHILEEIQTNCGATNRQYSIEELAAMRAGQGVLPP